MAKVESKELIGKIKKRYVNGEYIWQIAHDLNVSEHKVVLTLLDSGLYHPREGL